MNPTTWSLFHELFSRWGVLSGVEGAKSKKTGGCEAAGFLFKTGYEPNKRANRLTLFIKFEPNKSLNRLMAHYNWQLKDWPNFTYTLDSVEDDLFLFAEKVGKVTGMLNALPNDTQLEAIIEMMVFEAIKTSEIEGEYLSRKDVLSSIRKNLGLITSPVHIQDKKAEGIGEGAF